MLMLILKAKKKIKETLPELLIPVYPATFDATG